MKPGPSGNLGVDWTEEYQYFHGESQPKAIRSLIHPDKVNRLFKDSHIMPKISEMIPSNYLKQADFDQDYIVTVHKIEYKNIAMDGKPAEMKWLVRYEEFDKPMVLNSTNIQLMAKACGSEATEDWIGKKVIVYTDPNVSFGGELVGGLRVKKYKAPSQPTAPKARAAAVSESEGHANRQLPDEDDVPF